MPEICTIVMIYGSDATIVMAYVQTTKKNEREKDATIIFSLLGAFFFFLCVIYTSI